MVKDSRAASGFKRNAPRPFQPRHPQAPTPLCRGWRLRLYTIIFESDTRAGRTFDIALIGLILLSVAVVVADSMPRLQTALAWHLHRAGVGLHGAVHGGICGPWCACATRCVTR